MKNNMHHWENRQGIQFLRKIGLKRNQTVLDFGARIGHYSIPAAFVVGPNGKVYALDKEKTALDELERKAKRLKLKNIATIATTGQVLLPFNTESIDTVLLYDVLHYLDQDNRNTLYTEIYRILKPKACSQSIPSMSPKTRLWILSKIFVWKMSNRKSRL